MSAKEESLVVDDVRLFQVRCPSCQPNPNSILVKTQRVGDKSLCVLQCGCMCVAVLLCVCCSVVVCVLQCGCHVVVCRWEDAGEGRDEGVKWSKLEHCGPVFAEAYE